MRTALINLSSADNKAMPILAEGLTAFGKMFCSDYGYDPSLVEVHVFANEAQAPTGWIKALVLDDLDAPGAMAYHDRDDQGNPYIKCGFHVIPNGELFRGPSGDGASLMGELQHEWAETMFDPFANSFYDIDIVDPQGSGKVYHSAAGETEDPVQEVVDSFDVQGTKCDRTNYVLPPWFDPTAPRGTKVDRIGALPGPGTVAAGGYVIVRESFTQDEQVFARCVRLDHHVPMRMWRAQKKASQHSRTARRLAKVVKL